MNYLKPISALLIFLFFALSLMAKSDDEPVDKIRYGIKSGIIESKYDMYDGFIKGRQIITFDDFGEKVRYYVTSIIKDVPMLRDIIDISIFKGGETFTFNPVTKKETTHGLFNTPHINFINIKTETRKEYNLNVVGKDIICGKECVKYSINKEYEFEGFYWVWNGIIMKTDVDVFLYGRLLIEAEKIEENVEVPNSIFDVPSDINFE